LPRDIYTGTKRDASLKEVRSYLLQQMHPHLCPERNAALHDQGMRQKAKMHTYSMMNPVMRTTCL